MSSFRDTFFRCCGVAFLLRIRQYSRVSKINSFSKVVRAADIFRPPIGRGQDALRGPFANSIRSILNLRLVELPNHEFRRAGLEIGRLNVLQEGEPGADITGIPFQRDRPVDRCSTAAAEIRNRAAQSCFPRPRPARFAVEQITAAAVAGFRMVDDSGPMIRFFSGERKLAARSPRWRSLIQSPSGIPDPAFPGSGAVCCL